MRVSIFSCLFGTHLLCFYSCRGHEKLVKVIFIPILKYPLKELGFFKLYKTLIN